MNVSVIIPAYNAVETIADTLESLIAQTYPHWEAIVVNDGSSDATDEITREFVERDARIRMITQPNGGEGAARNTGIAQAQYDWLLFLDADDWILVRTPRTDDPRAHSDSRVRRRPLRFHPGSP